MKANAKIRWAKDFNFSDFKSKAGDEEDVVVDLDYVSDVHDLAIEVSDELEKAHGRFFEVNVDYTITNADQLLEEV